MLALRPLGGSVVIFRPFCRMPMGNFGCGAELSQRRNCGLGLRAGRSSMIFSSSLSQLIMRWQLASSTQWPPSTPSSMSRTACGDWPWPSAIVSKGTFFCSASWMSWLVGSTPGERTKMSGADGTDSTITCVRSSTGGSVKRWPRLLTMKDVTAKTMRSGRRDRTMMRRCSSVHLFSHSPGSRAAVVSGSGWRYHVFQSRGLDEKDETMLRKLYSLSSSVMLSHAVSLIQSEHGLGGCCVRSKTWPPRRKKLYSSIFIFRAPWRIFEQIWNEKSSLCASKSPRHVLR
mmetsp:Transcript_17838/g.51894  ORF Transcript_17838/g.51894 Transcript_17838/m.51894 type:complete len:287 (-) Transcript_17838:5645-6505(-)